MHAHHCLQVLIRIRVAHPTQRQISAEQTHVALAMTAALLPTVGYQPGHISTLCATCRSTPTPLSPSVDWSTCRPPYAESDFRVATSCSTSNVDCIAAHVLPTLCSISFQHLSRSVCFPEDSVKELWQYFRRAGLARSEEYLTHHSGKTICHLPCGQYNVLHSSIGTDHLDCSKQDM